MPTLEQLQQGYLRCRELTNHFVSIHLVTLDPRTRNVVIVAGEEIDIVIRPNGTWRFE